MRKIFYFYTRTLKKTSHKNMLFPMFEWLSQCELQAQGRKKISCGVK